MAAKLSPDAGDLARALLPVSLDPTRRLRRDLQVGALDSTQSERAFHADATHIREMRSSGDSLYLIDVAAKDFDAVLMHAPEMIEGWLTGYCEPTDEFRRRVQLAEGAFLVGLCEALLGHDPARGIRLGELSVQR